MNELRKKLEREQELLEKTISWLNEQKLDAPDGNLVILSAGKNTRYYHTKEGRRKYIPKSNKKLPVLLAQQSYNEKLHRLVKRRLTQINTILKDYQDHEIEQVYLKLPEQRQRLIQPVFPTLKQKVEQWEKKQYEGKGFSDTKTEIYTDRGERVRSKSEKILADYFNKNGISYKYEKPLYLKGYGIVYPDFTFISPKTREEIYWEHEGRMDDPGYAQKAVKKIKLYENNNIYIGERLILTFETENSLVNPTDIARKVEKYLKE